MSDLAQYIFTCVKCDAEQRVNTDGHPRVSDAQTTLTFTHRWEIVRFDFGWTAATDYLCPDCHILPLGASEEQEAELTYVADPN